MGDRTEGYQSKRLLFIIKERSVYNTKTRAYGLFNSCDFVVRAMNGRGVAAEAVQVVDNNCIDREVTRFKPTHCFVEAVWVVPSKFEVLARLHPTVKWVIRLHSMIPFLASEGMAFEWLNGYMELRKRGIDISISCNNDKLYRHLRLLYGKSVTYTPNIYLPDAAKPCNEDFSNYGISGLNIGCFGALRVLKNHPQQALWAMRFADGIRQTLNFHVNVSEHEQREAGPILRNLRGIFSNTRHNLVEHPWYEHSDFLGLVRRMDMGMQVSFTETFNITAADFVHCGVPIVVSEDITFVHSSCRVDPSDEEGVMEAMCNAYDNYIPFMSGGFLGGSCMICRNRSLLSKQNDRAVAQWLSVISK